MATKSRLMASGMPSLNANHLGQDASSSIAATGTLSTNAAVVAGNFVIVTTTPANSGVILMNAAGSATTVVYNGGGATLKVYPASGQTINNGAANAAISVPTLKSVILVGTEGAWIGAVSA